MESTRRVHKFLTVAYEKKLLPHVHMISLSRHDWTIGFGYDVDVLKNRYRQFKKQYYEIKAMVSQNVFQWDIGH